MAKANLTTASQYGTTSNAVKAREIDFVSRFATSWEALSQILGIIEPIKKAPGTTLVSYETSVTLQSGAVAEGAEIPYSKATLTPVHYGDVTLEKYCKAVSLEAVNKYGANIAIQKTDDAFLKELQSTVMSKFYTFLQTGTLTGTKSTFQKAVATAVGKVTNKFKSIHRDCTEIIVFANVLDVYDYLGTANITIQTAEGVSYVKNFMGIATLVLTSDITQGKVIAVPASNIDLYYVDPGDGDFAQLGLDYTVQGETNLIGFHANGNYSTAVGESYALLGMALWAEYLDGIAVITIGTEA